MKTIFFRCFIKDIVYTFIEHALVIGIKIAEKHQAVFISASGYFHLERCRFPEKIQVKLAPGVILKYPCLNRVGCGHLQEALHQSVPTGAFPYEKNGSCASPPVLLCN